MSALRKTLMALGFMTAGALGAVTLSAVAQDAPDSGQWVSPYQALVQSMTPEQQDAFQAFRDSRRASAEENRAARDAEREQMKALLQADPIDRKAVLRTVEQRGEDRLANELDRTEELMDLLEYFTPEQRAQLAQMVERRRGRGGPGMRGPGMRGQGAGQGGYGRGGRGQGGYGQGGW